MKKKQIAALILLSCLTAKYIGAQDRVAPYIAIRSQGVNAARHLAGWTNHIHTFNMDVPYGSLSVTGEYTRTFRPNRITRCLFGDNVIGTDDPQIKISGSNVPNRGQKDWLADYFYLPTDFKSTVQFKPRIDNFIVDFNFYVGLDQWFSGLYLTIFAPIAHTRWHLNIKEQVNNPGVNAHDPGYFTPAELPRGRLLNNFEEFANGQSIDPIVQTVDDTKFTIATQPLQQAKISSKRLKRTRLADLRLLIGWNFCQDDDYHAGFNIQTTGPTGNRPKGRFLFEPIVGNGHHWELGIGLNGHYRVWQNQDEQAYISLYGDVNVTHLFRTRQKRTFDLKTSTFSRYVLAQKLGTNRRDPRLDGDSDADVEFQREFTPVANLTTISVDVSVGIQADMVAMATFNWHGFSWDLGYNFWVRSCENIKIRGDNQLQDNTTWALKGDASVFGFDMNSNPVHLAATQSKATIKTGTNATNADPTDVSKAPNTNIGVDNAVQAVATTGQVFVAPGGLPGIPIRTSNPVVFIKESDVNIDDAETKGLSSKIFTHFSYTWEDKEDWVPYLGFGAEVEFDHNRRDSSSKDECLRCAISQWGVWAKGGIDFD